jgi:hypothetical protein
MNEEDPNDFLLDYTTAKIHKEIRETLNEVGLPYCFSQLTNYILVENVDHLRAGAFLRWITLTQHSEEEEDLYLNRGATLCEIKSSASGIHLILKTFTGRRFQIDFGECIVFQKLTSQQRVILNALDHINS